MDTCYCQHARARHLAPPRGSSSSRRGLHRLRRSLLLVSCTAQPPKQLQTVSAEQHGDGTDSSISTSSRANSPAVAVQEVSTTDVVTAASSFSDFAATASPMAEQLAGQLVVVSATTPAGSTAGTLTAAGAHDGSTASPALPQGLPSPVTIDASLSSSFGSVDDDMVPADAAAAQAAAKARAVLRKQRPPAHEPWWPPVEFSALVGLCVAVLISGLTNLFLCKPVLLSQLVRGKPKVMKECASCCASPAAQANHLVLMQRQPQRLPQPLPLPLRQYLDLDQLPAPTYKVPSLVVLPEHTKDGVTASLVAAQEWMHSRVAYQLQQLASANVSTKVLALWLLSMPFIALAAALYQQAAAVTFKEAMYKVYALLMRVPGIGIAKENNTSSYIVANMVFLAGVFSFAAVIGIVSDEIKIGIKNSRAGNYNMRLDGHIVLLNWNSSSTALLRHIASAYADEGMFSNRAPWPWNNRPPVVVLADKPKVEMDTAVHEMLKDRGLKLEVHTREGNPFKMSDLRKVAANKASTIIVLDPESTSSANAEAIKVSVAMSLTALGGSAGNQRVVVQGPSAGTSTVLCSLEATTRHAGGHCTIQAFELPDAQLTHRLVAQTAAQPGILTCWLDLLALTSSSAEFFCAPLPAVLTGKPYVELRRAFLHAVLCGYSTPDGQVRLNPAETDVPPDGSRLILLGRGGAPHLMAAPGSSTLYDTAATAAAERLKKERTYKSKARSILVTNWPMAGVPQLMESFSLFTPADSKVTFILPEEAPATWPSRLGQCRFSFTTAENPTGVKVLLEAGIKTADAVVLGSGPPVGAELEADARILSAVLQVQDAVMASKRRDAPHLVAPIRRYATSKLASQFLDVLAAEQPPAVAAAAVRPGWLPPAVQQAAAAATQQVAAASQAAPVVPSPAQNSAAAAAASSASSTSTNPATSTSSSAAETISGSTGSSSSSSSSSGSSSTASAGAGSSSKGSGNLLTSALKAVGVWADTPGGSTPPQQQQQQQPKAAVMTDPEFLVPGDVASALMTQVVSEPAYSDIMRHLMLNTPDDPEGMELYLRNPASFNIPTGVPVSFAEVSEAVRLTRQTAIGYIRSKDADRQRRKAVLGCSGSHRVTFGEADRIVVIALDYNV